MKVGVVGAGAIGGFLGGRIAAAGDEVILVGRPRVLRPLESRGLVLEDLDGTRRELAPGTLVTSEDPAAVAGCDVVLLTTKAGDVRDAARSLANVGSMPIVGLQNGAEHARWLREILGERGLAGMVSWNVTWRDERTLRRATSGPVIVDGDPRLAPLLASLRRAGIDARGVSPIEPVLWTKLLFNLNNALNALSALPLRDELSDRRWRRVLAASIREGLAAMRAAGIRAARLGRMDPQLSSRVLPAPDWLFRLVAGAMVRIDPAARSSMADDLDRGRRTEIDDLNGAVVRLGALHGVPTPVNARVVAAIRAREAGEPLRVSPEELLGNP